MTLKLRVIPCLDVKDGRVVKGINFEGLRDAGDPVEQAKAYNAQNADEICFLDIAASADNRGTILDVVTRTAKEVFIPLTVGGGVRSVDDIRQLLLAGADKASLNSAAVQNPELVQNAANQFGAQAIVVAIDARKTNNGFRIFTHGGKNATDIDAVEWAQRMAAYGAGELLLTSMDRDGTKDGYDLELTRLVSNAVNIPVIASGGVGNLQHLADGAKAGASALLAASIFHYGEYTIPQAKDHLARQGFAVRVPV